MGMPIGICAMKVSAAAPAKTRKMTALTAFMWISEEEELGRGTDEDEGIRDCETLCGLDRADPTCPPERWRDEEEKRRLRTPRAMMPKKSILKIRIAISGRIIAASFAAHRPDHPGQYLWLWPRRQCG